MDAYTERIQSAAEDFGIVSALYDISQIAGDLSPRKYFRLTLRPKKRWSINSSSILAMVFDSTEPPEVETSEKVMSDDAYIRMTEFLQNSNIPVPEIYFDSRANGVLLIEDFGNEPLIRVAESGQADRIARYYEEAIDVLLAIQALHDDGENFAFKRGLNEAVYNREMNQFLEFLVRPYSSEDLDESKTLFSKLASEVSALPRVLVHRDFHSWNLMVDPKGNLGVIDFQDALLGPRVYDLVALLHERDIDSVLTKECVLGLEDSFFSRVKDGDYLREFEYPRVQLQRDIKVAGLFQRVYIERGLESYRSWVPGTLRRIQRTLERLGQSTDIYNGLEPILESVYMEFQADL